MLHLFHLHDLRFLQDFDGIEALIVIRLHQMNSSKTSCSQSSLEREVCQRVFALGRARVSALGGSAPRGTGRPLYARSISLACRLR